MARPENPIEYTSTDELYRGSRIRELRREKGLSREKMASLLGCHPDSLSNVEANAVNPSNELLSKIANVLEAPLEYFTQAPVHPRILSKKAAQAIAQPQVVSPLGSRPSTTPQSSREALLKLLEAAGIVSDEDLKGFALVKIKDSEAEDKDKAAGGKEKPIQLKSGDRAISTPMPTAANLALGLPYSLLYITFDQIEARIKSRDLSEEQMKRMAAGLLDSTNLLLEAIKPQYEE